MQFANNSQMTIMICIAADIRVQTIGLITARNVTIDSQVAWRQGDRWWTLRWFGVAEFASTALQSMTSSQEIIVLFVIRLFKILILPKNMLSYLLIKSVHTFMSSISKEISKWFCLRWSWLTDCITKLRFSALNTVNVLTIPHYSYIHAEIK